MAKEKSKADRRHQRIATPKGVWVAWQDGKQQNVSRVRDLNVGRAFHRHPYAAGPGGGRRNSTVRSGG